MTCGVPVRHVDPDGRRWGSLKAMASAYGLTAQCVNARLKRGLSLKQALKPKGSVRHPRTGELVTWVALAEEVGITSAAMRLRYAKGSPLGAPRRRQARKVM